MVPIVVIVECVYWDAHFSIGSDGPPGDMSVSLIFEGHWSGCPRLFASQVMIALDRVRKDQCPIDVASRGCILMLR